MLQRLKTKRGELTGYAFACGYVERSSACTIASEHSLLTVTYCAPDRHRYVWVPAPTVKLARKIARALNRGDLLAAVALSGRPWGVASRGY